MAYPTSIVDTYVVHVKEGYEQRERHIRREFAREGVPVNFFLDFDIPDLTDEVVQRWTTPEVGPLATVSLALKQFHVWRRFLEGDKPYLLLFEDDVFLARGFADTVSRCLEEFADPHRQAAIYLGNAGNYYIARRKLCRGRLLYPARHARCADSYIITRSTAEARCRWVERNKLAGPIDLEINRMDAELDTEVLWLERPVVEQGTHNGAFQSSLAGSKHPAWYKKFEWRWKKFWRQEFGHQNA